LFITYPVRLSNVLGMFIPVLIVCFTD